MSAGAWEVLSERIRDRPSFPVLEWIIDDEAGPFYFFGHGSAAVEIREIATTGVDGGYSKRERLIAASAVNGYI
jgi:hypothetical protein